MFEQRHAVAQRQVAGEIFRTVGDFVPDIAAPDNTLFVDAQHAVALRFQKFDHLMPAGAVIPEFGLAGGLRGDADIGFGYLARGMDAQVRDDFARVDAQNMACRAVQPDRAKIKRLLVKIATEEQPDAPRSRKAARGASAGLPSSPVRKTATVGRRARKDR